MTGFVPQSLIRLQGRIVTRWACRRLAHWCARTARMKEEDFLGTLVQSVVSSGPEDPLKWLYRAMRDAAGKAGPYLEGMSAESLTLHAQPINVRLVTAINQLSRGRYALLAAFMWGARCEDVAKWQGSSQEDVANQIALLVREVASRVFGSRE